jgi:hypothetical protein
MPETDATISERSLRRGDEIFPWERGRPARILGLRDELPYSLQLTIQQLRFILT